MNIFSITFVFIIILKKKHSIFFKTLLSCTYLLLGHFIYYIISTYTYIYYVSI